jgi:hypothetical protein
MNLNLRRLIIAAIVLSTNLIGQSGAVLAQPVDVDIDRGADGGCTASGPPSDQLTVCSDLRPGSGRAVNEPGAAAKEITPTPAPEPAPASASDAEAAPETTDAAVASATDQDADNAPDETEPGLGLDPTNPDTDADGVADGDEPNIYGTDALNADTDGDGVSDGEELFGIHTDPLVADNASTEGGESVAETP